MNQEQIKKMVFDHFDGNATLIQRNFLETWLNDHSHQELYYRYLDEWESERPQLALDTDDAFGKLQHRVQVAPVPVGEKAKPLSVRPWSIRYGWAAAAAVLIVTVLGGYLLRDQIRYQTYQTAYGETGSYELPDGTRVTLNANSTLRVPRFGFGAETRDVFLKGEGEFNVKHLPTHQRFVVRAADNFQVEVLGTEFVVYARERGKRVYLRHGKVKLGLPQGKQLTMKPGNVVTVSNSGQYRLQQTAPAQPYVAWKDHWFYFDDTSLLEITAQIRERFGVKVVVADTALAHRRIAGNFKAESADDLLQTLAGLLNLSIVKGPKHIQLEHPKEVN
ncbi:FecR family protein [Rudanella lutea]|uniref:FecR family protein n=1 Tax=Rudanella lutea TaxID=451374 RepID=UPI000371ADBD|nr:FecR domain-containing protein [Rudanella lutea]